MNGAAERGKAARECMRRQECRHERHSKQQRKCAQRQHEAMATAAWRAWRDPRPQEGAWWWRVHVCVRQEEAEAAAPEDDREDQNESLIQARIGARSGVYMSRVRPNTDFAFEGW